MRSLIVPMLLALTACAGRARPRETPASAPAHACGRLPGEPVVPKKWQWGGEAGNPVCDRAATVWGNIPDADLVCQTDADCVPFSGDGNCWQAALNRTAAVRPEYQTSPCGNPLSGACAAPSPTAWCSQGCCTTR